MVAELSCDPRNAVERHCVIQMISTSLDVIKTRKRALLRLKNEKHQSRANPEVRFRSDVLEWTKAFLPPWLGRGWIYTYGRIEGTSEAFQKGKVHAELDVSCPLL